MPKKRKQKLAIIGAGLLGEQIARSAAKNDYQVVGFYDDVKTGFNEKTGQPILGKTKDIEADFKLKKFDCLMIGVGYTLLKERRCIFEKFKGKVPFARVIHHSCQIDESVELGEGIYLMAGTILDAGVTLKDNVLCNVGCVVAHDSIIGAHSFLGPRVTVAGKSTIGQACFIGVGATIMDLIKVGDNAIIGAGAVVTNNIPSASLAVGVPAKVKRKLKV
jgi:sugar O-acyltransferase (sialic acid O-acetyltransferase NeuD family)